jgi:succinyl-CoA synthetase beta subunit
MQDFLSKRAAFFLFDNADLIKQGSDIIRKLYQLFIENDASLAEINPLVLTKEGNLIAVDAKITFDDNALFRHPGIAGMFEPDKEEQKERMAKEKGFSYVGLTGNIGCMVNGAGLAMATMDMIKHFGGNPANFLDIGGSSNPDKTIEAMKLLSSDSKVNAILINIFGGITRCDDIAKGLLEAFKQIEIKIPVVIRLTGTNEQKGQELLKGTPFIIARTMEEAAETVIRLCV